MGKLSSRCFVIEILGESYEAERLFFEKNIAFARARFFLRKTFFC